MHEEDACKIFGVLHLHKNQPHCLYEFMIKIYLTIFFREIDFGNQKNTVAFSI